MNVNNEFVAERLPDRGGRTSGSSRVFQGLLLLILFCLLFSIVFRSALSISLKSRRERAAEEFLSAETEGMYSESMIEISPELESPLERFSTELIRISGEQEHFRLKRGALSLREQEQRIADIWDTELKRISDCIIEGLSETERISFLESQSRFRRERRSESMKLARTGSSDTGAGVDYLKKYSSLTEERCYELLKEYFE